jgi:hypothetical protein
VWGLSETEILLTIAELSVAFAGFASVASILGRRFSQEDPRINAGRLSIMLIVSFTATGLALTPIIPMILDWPSRWVWRSSGAFGLAVQAIVVPIVICRVRQMMRYPGFNPGANTANFSLTVVTFIGLACSLLGIPAERPFAAYFISLLTLLGISGTLFYRVIASLQKTDNPPAQE